MGHREADLKLGVGLLLEATSSARVLILADERAGLLNTKPHGRLKVFKTVRLSDCVGSLFGCRGVGAVGVEHVVAAVAGLVLPGNFLHLKYLFDALLPTIDVGSGRLALCKWVCLREGTRQRFPSFVSVLFVFELAS